MTAPTQDAQPIAVRRLDHVAIKTPRLAESRDFYVQVIGLTVGPRPAFAFSGLWLYAGQDDVVHLAGTAGAQTQQGSLAGPPRPARVNPKPPLFSPPSADATAHRSEGAQA